MLFAADVGSAAADSRGEEETPRRYFLHDRGGVTKPGGAVPMGQAQLLTGKAQQGFHASDGGIPLVVHLYFLLWFCSVNKASLTKTGMRVW